MTTETNHQHGYTSDKSSLQRRMKRLEGQVRGVSKMIDEDRYCIDVLTQISAAKSALDSVAMTLMEDHLDHCVATAIATGDGAEEKLREATEAIRRLVKS
jgi:DNA-binding FrmR family transcriptional regulator